MSRAPRTFRSRVDLLLVLPTLVVPLVGLYLVSGLPAAARYAGARLVGTLLLLTVLLFSLWVTLSTRYTLDAVALSVCSGPFRWRVLLSEIRSVSASSSPLTGPALSLRRLRVERRDGTALLISPTDPAAFMAELRERGVRV
jgi:Bacterial PH domain